MDNGRDSCSKIITLLSRKYSKYTCMFIHVCDSSYCNEVILLCLIYVILFTKHNSKVCIMDLY